MASCVLNRFREREAHPQCGMCDVYNLEIVGVSEVIQTARSVQPRALQEIGWGRVIERVVVQREWVSDGAKHVQIDVAQKLVRGEYVCIRGYGNTVPIGAAVRKGLQIECGVLHRVDAWWASNRYKVSVSTRVHRQSCYATFGSRRWWRCRVRHQIGNIGSPGWRAARCRQTAGEHKSLVFRSCGNVKGPDRAIIYGRHWGRNGDGVGARRCVRIDDCERLVQQICDQQLAPIRSKSESRELLLRSNSGRLKRSHELVGQGGEHIDVVTRREIDLVSFGVNKNRRERIG